MANARTAKSNQRQTKLPDPPVEPVTATFDDDPTDEPRGTRAPAVNRTVAILRLLARSDVPLGVNSIAREVNIVPSSCHHIIRALEIEDLVEVDSIDRRVSIGLGFVHLARRALGKFVPYANAQAEIEDIAEAFSVTASINRVDRQERMIVVAVAEPVRPFAIRIRIGHRLSAWISATGRLWAANSQVSPAELRRKFQAIKWSVPPSFDEWMASVDHAAKHGIGIDSGNFLKGMEVHAAAIFEHGEFQGSIAAVTTVGQLDSDHESALHEALRAAAKRLSTDGHD